MTMNLPRAVLLALAGFVLGCGSKAETDTDVAANGVPALAESYWNDSIIIVPLSVLQAKEKAGSNETIAVEGRVSGFVPNRASFKLTDRSLKACDERPEDTCKTPWDYCCETPEDIAKATMVVEIRDGDQLAKAALKGFHGFDNLSNVVVTGVPHKLEAGNVVLVAKGIHVKP